MEAMMRCSVLLIVIVPALLLGEVQAQQVPLPKTAAEVHGGHD
jgi:hypothetical protein